jgi:hypothetical protein
MVSFGGAETESARCDDEFMAAFAGRRKSRTNE